MKIASAIAFALIPMISAGVALADPATGNSVVSVNSSCSQADQGIYFASTVTLASSGVYYLNRTIINNVGSGSSPIYVPIIEHWSITPNSGNTGGSYGVAIPDLTATGYPISGTYTGSVNEAFGGFTFTLALNCGSTLTGSVFYSG